jgi:site-specific DNA-methyltransferase (adenine-specific)
VQCSGADQDDEGIGMTFREEIIGDCRLILGDCRDVLPKLGKVDCIVSDLPYRLESGGNTNQDMGGKFKVSNYDNSGQITTCDIEFDEVMPLLVPIMPRGHAYFMVNNRYVAACENAALGAGFRFHNWLVWDKSTGTPNRWYMKNCEFTLFCYTGAAKSIADCGSRQLIKCKNIINGEHENQKPVELMEHYIGNSTSIGQLVLDPFMGSGTTGIAAKRLNRKFVGIEIDPKHFDRACRRIENETQSNLFNSDLSETIS